MGAWDRWDEVVGGTNPDPLDVLRVTGMYERYLDAVRTHAVRAARGQGRSWEEIGRALGVRRQAAWQRFQAACSGVRAEDLRQWLPPIGPPIPEEL